jgi:hypothetical protein
MVTMPLAIVPGPAVPSSVNGVDVMSSNATPYVAVGGLFPSVTVSALTNCDEMFADTLNVMKKNGTAPVIAACGERVDTAVVERTNDVIAGAPDGNVVDDVAVSETPAGAPGAIPIVATEELDEATVSAPPPVGTDCVTGADVGPGPATGVVLTLPAQLATIRPPETTRAAAAIRSARNGVGIKFPLVDGSVWLMKRFAAQPTLASRFW